MESNKLIADFLGAKPIILGASVEYEMYGIIECIKDGTNEKHFFIPDEMEFREDWRWLMPVVDKIEGFQDGKDGDSIRGHLYNFRIEQNFVYILDGESMDVIIEMNGDNKLDATYNAVVEFIKWFNKKQ